MLNAIVFGGEDAFEMRFFLSSRRFVFATPRSAGRAVKSIIYGQFGTTIFLLIPENHLHSDFCSQRASSDHVSFSSDLFVQEQE